MLDGIKRLHSKWLTTEVKFRNIIILKEIGADIDKFITLHKKVIATEHETLV